MISSRTLIRMARKWQKLAVHCRKRITLPKSTSSVEEDPCSFSRVKKGHFVVYSADKRRFMIPLTYLQNDIFRELLDAAEEEFGLPRGSPITLPCNAVLVEYVLSLMQRNVPKDLQKALVMSMANGSCLSSSQLLQEPTNQYQALVHSF